MQRDRRSLSLCVQPAACTRRSPGDRWGGYRRPPLDISGLSVDTATADALVLNDLAASAPDDKIVPAFDAERVRWDIDVETYSSHPRVQYYLGYFEGVARTGWRPSSSVAPGTSP